MKFNLDNQMEISITFLNAIINKIFPEYNENELKAFDEIFC